MHARGKISNILIIKPGAIGDLLQLTPVIRSLKKYYPAAKLSILVGSSATAALFKHNPHVSETLIFDGKNEHKSFLSLLELWRQLRRKKYDLVLNFQRSNVKTWFLVMAALPCRVLVYHRAKKKRVHAVVNYLETVAPLGISTADWHLELFLGTEDQAFADTLFSSKGFNNAPVIALNPGASHAVNRWGTDQFAALTDMIAEKLRANIVLTGGGEDRKLAEEIMRKTKAQLLSVVGKTSLLQLGALLKKCALLVTGDTGPLHIAAAVGTKAVALFGAADPERTGPLGGGHRVIQAKEVPCVPCRSRTCTNSVYLECMEKIPVQGVLDAITSMLPAS